MSEGCSIALLGPLEVTTPTARVSIAGPKKRALLARLAVEVGAYVDQDRLADEVGVARQTVREYVKDLRRDLGEDVLPPARPGLGYRLALTGDAVDTRRFEQLVRLAAASVPAQAAIHLDEAMALWRGQPLGEFVELPWAAAEARRLDLMFIDAQSTSFEVRLGFGEDHTLCADLQRVVEAHPYEERFVGQLMRAHFRAGRTREALNTFQRARALLDRDLGNPPGPMLIELERRMLANDPVLGSPPAPVVVASASTEAARRARAARAAPKGPLPLAGRDAELARLVDALASDGPRCVILTGDAGMGKTRLVQEALAVLDDERVLAGRCDAEQDRPFQYLLDAIAPRLPLASAANLRTTRSSGPPGDLERDALVDELRHVLSDDAPLLVVDDAQWLDPDSAYVLRRLFRTTAIRLLLSAREGADGQHEPLVALLGEVGHNTSVTTLPLDALDGPAVVDLCRAAMAGVPDDELHPLAQQIVARSGGNALYVQELVLDLQRRNATTLPAETVPTSLRAVVARQASPLGPGALDILRTAAVMAARVEITDLAAVTALDVAAVTDLCDRAVQHGLLADVDDQPGAYEFHHQLAREALAAGVLQGDRLRIHVAAADVLRARLSPGDLGHADVARHLLAAGRQGDKAAAAHHLQLAARVAARYGAWQTASAHHRDSADLFEVLGDPVAAADERLDAAAMENRAGDINAAKDLCEQAAKTAIARRAPTLLARAAVSFGGSTPTGADIDDPRSAWIIDEALRLDLPPRWEALVAGRAVHILYWRLGLDERRQMLERAVRAAAIAADPATTLDVQVHRFWALAGPDTAAERTTFVETLSELASQVDEPDLQLEALKCRLHLHVESGRFPAASHASRALHDIARRWRLVEPERLAAAWDATVATIEGRWGQAEAAASRSQELFRRRGHRFQAAVAYRMQTWMMRWFTGDLNEHLTWTTALADGDPTRPVWRALAAWSAAELGRADVARGHLAAIDLDAFTASERRLDWWPVMVGCTHAATLLDDAARSAVLAEAWGRNLDEWAVMGIVAVYGISAHFAGLARTTAGDLDGGIEALERAVERHHDRGARPLEVASLAALADSLRRRGRADDRRRAETIAADAVAAATDLGLTNILRRLSAP